MELSIRKLGNSAGIILPAALLRTLNLSVGSFVKAEEVEGALILTPVIKKRYSLSELIAQCDPNAPLSEEMKAWDQMTPVGKEIA
jgi:antitoxin ChpS